MPNYIKAELWKVSQRKAFYVMLGLLFAGVTFFFVLFGTGSTFSKFVFAVADMMIVGILVVPILAQLVDGRALETAKNEVSFGISRMRIYLGKLLASCLLGVVVSLLLLGLCLGWGWLLIPHGDIENAYSMLLLCAVCIFGAFPLWCGMLSLCHMLALLTRSTAGWIVGYYLLILFGQPIFSAVARGVTGWGNLIQGNLLDAILSPSLLLMYSPMNNWPVWSYLACCWGIGLGWLVVTTAIGLAWYKRVDCH